VRQAALLDHLQRAVQAARLELDEMERAVQLGRKELLLDVAVPRRPVLLLVQNEPAQCTVHKQPTAISRSERATRSSEPDRAEHNHTQSKKKSRKQTTHSRARSSAASTSGDVACFVRGTKNTTLASVPPMSNPTACCSDFPGRCRSEGDNGRAAAFAPPLATMQRCFHHRRTTVAAIAAATVHATATREAEACILRSPVW
jgi:hypothetical protein